MPLVQALYLQHMHCLVTVTTSSYKRQLFLSEECNIPNIWVASIRCQCQVRLVAKFSCFDLTSLNLCTLLKQQCTQRCRWSELSIPKQVSEALTFSYLTVACYASVLYLLRHYRILTNPFNMMTQPYPPIIRLSALAIITLASVPRFVVCTMYT